MFGLLVLISVVCVPILGMLAVGEWMRKRGLKHQQHECEKSAVVDLYLNQQ
jgi:hypothetical protein|tara:strand:+ start:404 stop:556 length:153 start_codon:yes stop_codon:yes gene_type:complete